MLTIEARVSTRLKLTREVSLCNRLVWNILVKKGCLTELTRIDDQREARDDDYSDWPNLETLRPLLSLHIREKGDNTYPRC